MTPAQKQTLKAHMLANQTQLEFGAGLATIASVFGAANLGSGDALVIKDHYNAVASPDFWVWRTSVTKQEIVSQTSRSATTFTWAGNGFISRSVQELMAWDELFATTGTCNPSLVNVRQAFADIFSGGTNALANRTHIDTVARRKASLLERVFATGTGGDSNANAGTLVVEETITGDGVSDIHGLQ